MIFFTTRQIMKEQWQSKEKEESETIPKMAEISFSEMTFSVEIVDTEALQARGLGGRDGLCEHCGMLFPFARSGRHAFWMKDMRFPIDIIWIANGRVVFMEESVDFHDQQRIYVPDEAADSVVELPAGSVKRFGIHIGEGVALREPRR